MLTGELNPYHFQLALNATALECPIGLAVVVVHTTEGTS
jgi:hypothetical protein